MVYEPQGAEWDGRPDAGAGGEPCQLIGRLAADDVAEVAPPRHRDAAQAEQALDLAAVRELRVETDNSVWFLRRDRYMRMPRWEEQPRPPEVCLDGALDDATWHEHRYASLLDTQEGTRLRIIPAGRPDGANGIITGIIVSVSQTRTLGG